VKLLIVPQEVSTSIWLLFTSKQNSPAPSAELSDKMGTAGNVLALQEPPSHDDPVPA